MAVHKRLCMRLMQVKLNMTLPQLVDSALLCWDTGERQPLAQFMARLADHPRG